jgi:hypothetical protein
MVTHRGIIVYQERFIISAVTSRWHLRDYLGSDLSLGITAPSTTAVSTLLATLTLLTLLYIYG